MNSTSKIKILIVDDTPDIVNQLQQVLVSETYQVFVANSGEKALQRIELNEPDLILLDIIMPGIDGYETCRRIKSNPDMNNIPIIFMSALLETFDKVKAFGLGAVDYITKPMNTEELLVRINTHVSINQLQKQLRQVNNNLEEKVLDRTGELQRKNEEYESLIEELRQINEELVLAKEKAEESDRLKTAFLHNMSHEIRTPMNAINGFSRMLDKPELTSEKRQGFTKIIINSSNQLLSIVTDSLTISSLETRQEKKNMQIVCINQIITDLLSSYSPKAVYQNISMYAKPNLTDKQSECSTDKAKVIQILTNLINNALKFTHKGPRVLG